MRILVAAAGSHGDVLPFIGLCRELQARGHEVRLHASAYFASYAQEAGIELRPVAGRAEHIELLRDPDLAHPRLGHRVIARAIEQFLPALYEGLSADVDPGRTLVIGSLLAFPARLLKETHGVPCVMVHLAPATLRSTFDTPRFSTFDIAPYLPRWAKKLSWRAIDRWLLDPLYGAPLNRYRASLGLSPIRSLFGRWLNEAELILALFPDWFGAPQPDWPSNLRQTGFPLYDAGSGRDLPTEVEAFLDEGEEPVGFTAGTATASAHAYFEASIEACERSGRRGVLITHRPAQLPRSLPRGIAQFSYVPFGALLPRLAAFVHHGGIGTTSQALHAGVPQLIRPMAYDQLDNARRARALGVAVEVTPSRYHAEHVARLLEHLITDPGTRERCAHWAQAFGRADALQRSCDLILASVPQAPIS